MNPVERKLREVFPRLTDKDFGYHATDLYVVAYPDVEQWLNENLNFPTSMKPFIGNPEATDWNGAGKRCLDIPFGGTLKE